jgi:hypothetical protein
MHPAQQQERRKTGMIVMLAFLATASGQKMLSITLQVLKNAHFVPSHPTAPHDRSRTAQAHTMDSEVVG